MKVLSPSRMYSMCLLILVTLMTWHIVRPEVIYASEVSTFYGAGNCKCAELRNCPHWCDSGRYIVACHPHPETESCSIDPLNKPCGTGEECGDKDGGSFNCEVIIVVK